MAADLGRSEAVFKRVAIIVRSRSMRRRTKPARIDRPAGWAAEIPVT
jgi:hypothetical protein